MATDLTPEQTPEQFLIDAVSDYVGALSQPDLDALIAGARPPIDNTAGQPANDGTHRNAADGARAAQRRYGAAK